LPIRLSLADLLPADRESVMDLQAVSQEVGGVGYLIVLVGPTPNAETHLGKVEQSLKGDPEIRYTFHEREEYSLRSKGLYLIPRKEFDEVLESAKVVLQDGKKSMLDIGLETDQDRAQNLRRAKNRLKGFADGKAQERYFKSKDGQYAMLLAKPTFDSEDLGRSRKLVEETQSRVSKALGPTPFSLVGRYVDKVNDTVQIEHDIEFTSLISTIGIAIVLIFGLGSIRAAILTVLAVSLAMAWTLGAAHVLVGQINILTGFLLAILGGMGVEYGVHLVRRFYQEIAEGHTRTQALERSYLYTGRALGSAAITSASAFLILSFSDFRGFSELGKIAGVGILSIYLVYILCFPAIAHVIKGRPRFQKVREGFGFYPFGPQLRWVLLPLALIAIWGVSRAEFEYNFARMHDLSKETRRQHEFVDELFGRSFSPAAILATSGAQAKAVESYMHDPLRKDQVQEAISLARLLPTDMEDRYEEVERVASKLGSITDAELTKKSGMDGALIRSLVNSKPYTRKDLPPQLKDAFGQSGNIVLVYPAKDLDDAGPLQDFARLLTEARAKFTGVKIGSDVRIFSEILDHITHDGLIILLVFLGGAFVVMGLDFRNVFDAFDLEMQLIAGIFLLIGLMGLFGVRFSILNIAMVPAVLAAGIDMG
ncbi:MAG: hypothetical protein EOP11_17985, partial [Proteobacteria bacterium]